MKLSDELKELAKEIFISQLQKHDVQEMSEIEIQRLAGFSFKAADTYLDHMDKIEQTIRETGGFCDTVILNED